MLSRNLKELLSSEEEVLECGVKGREECVEKNRITLMNMTVGNRPTIPLCSKSLQATFPMFLFNSFLLSSTQKAK